jgi:NTP pyrophosphatase (non-canonical NTP hydrolase)
MQANEYQRRAMRTAPQITDAERLVNAALGLAGEAGEFADSVKKARYQGHDLNALELANELGDVLWYVALACAALGFDMSDVMDGNLRKLRQRYPDGFDAERSRNRE